MSDEQRLHAVARIAEQKLRGTPDARFSGRRKPHE